jgi:hypothetical protein
MTSGLYIVTLNNSRKMSVNANDLRIADRCIQVNRENCKIGKAMNFSSRQRSYFRVFDEKNVNFFRIVAVVNPRAAEKEILSRLKQYRMKGRTGRRNEWLHEISPFEVAHVVLRTLDDIGMRYERLEGIDRLLNATKTLSRVGNSEPAVVCGTASCRGAFQAKAAAGTDRSDDQSCRSTITFDGTRPST